MIKPVLINKQCPICQKKTDQKVIEIKDRKGDWHIEYHCTQCTWSESVIKDEKFGG